MSFEVQHAREAGTSAPLRISLLAAMIATSLAQTSAYAAETATPAATDSQTMTVSATAAADGATDSSFATWLTIYPPDARWPESDHARVLTRMRPRGADRASKLHRTEFLRFETKSTPTSRCASRFNRWSSCASHTKRPSSWSRSAGNTN